MLTQVLPSYLYQQYTQDPYSEDLQAFFTAYNTESQSRLDATNNLNLPIYTKQIAPLLDWTVYAIYGERRPSLGSPAQFSPLGVYDTVPYDTTAYTENITIGTSSFYIVDDDIFKRILTWNFYKGDGFQYTTSWLKRRVKRFLLGIDGVDFPIDQTYNISVVYSSNNTITITIPNYAIAPIFVSALESGVLHLPFQYNYTVVISPGTVSWENDLSVPVGWVNTFSNPINWYTPV
jgi:hypothetical protein